MENKELKKFENLTVKDVEKHFEKMRNKGYECNLKGYKGKVKIEYN